MMVLAAVISVVLTSDCSSKLNAPTRSGKQPANWKTVASYDYTDAKGDVRYVVERQEADGKKKFVQWHMNGGTKVYGIGGVERVLYRLQAVMASEEVVICEGEKCVHALEALGYVATTNSGGSSGS